MLSFVIPEDPRHPDPGEQVPPSPDPDEEIIDEPEYFPFDEPVPDLPTEKEAMTPHQTRGASVYRAGIPEDPIVPDPTDFPPIPPRSPNEPPPIEDPPVDPDDLPGDEPMIDPPPAQASLRVAPLGALFS